MRYEQLHGIHVGREVRQQLRGRRLLNEFVVLRGNLRNQLRAQIAGDFLRCIGLGDGLQISKNENPDSNRKKLPDERVENELLLRI